MGEFKPFTRLKNVWSKRMVPMHHWRNSFETLVSSFVVIGAFLSAIGFVAVNTPQPCPVSGCIYNSPLSLAESLFPAWLTLIAAGVIVFEVVRIELKREGQGSS